MIWDDDSQENHQIMHIFLLPNKIATKIYATSNKVPLISLICISIQKQTNSWLHLVVLNTKMYKKNLPKFQN